MKMTHRLLTAGVFAFALTLSSCDNDDEKGGQLSIGDAKSQIAKFNTDATADLQDLADADGLKAMQDFFDLAAIDEPFDGRIAADKNQFRAFLKDKGREFRSVFVPSSAINGKTNGEEAFDFDGHKGIYVWDAELQQFVYDGDATSIQIYFPTEGSTANNAKLVISAYQEQLVEDPEFGDTFYEPTLVEAALFVNDAEKASLDLAIDYDDLGFPQSAEVEVKITPFTASLSFDVSAATSSTISFSILHNQETLVSTNVTVKYADESKTEESLSSLEGFVQLKNLKLQGFVDAEGANGEEVDFNDFVKLTLYANNAKVGDIVFVTENEQAIPYVKYADGTQEKLEVVLQPVIDEVNALADSLDNNG
jgi:hypothetical protein